VSGQLEPDLERVALRVVELLATRRAVESHRRRAQLVRAVATALDEHPSASANQIAALVRGRRRVVLDTVREFRRDETRFPSTRYRSSAPVGDEREEESA
jgi:hypothetical protein